MELRFENIAKKYGKINALKNFSTILTNGVYGLLGPNGAGKTTLINILTGIENQTNGEIYFNDVSVKRERLNFLSMIGYLPQYPNFYKDFKAREFLHYMCAIKDIPKKISKMRTEEVLVMVNLYNEANKKIGSFSGGMRQRLGIAQAMLNDPKILVLDEPTSGLDPKERIRFRNTISKLSSDRIVILATHIVSDVEHMAKEIILLNKGKIVAQNTTNELIKQSNATVYSITTTDENINDYMDSLDVSNIQYLDGIYTLRIVSEEKNLNAIKVKPNLDDLFLYYFKEDLK